MAPKIMTHKVFTNGCATPSVSESYGYLFETSGETPITRLLNGSPNTTIIVTGGSSIMIVHGTWLVLHDACDYAMTLGDTLTLQGWGGKVWYEIARSVEVNPLEPAVLDCVQT